MDDWGMRDAVVSLVAALDYTVSEGSSLEMGELRKVNIAMRDLEQSIARWKGEAP